MLQLTNLKKAYGQRIILEIPDLALSDGAHWIKGNNGSGKTTLMKIIAGINPFEGNVSLNGIDLIKEPIAYRTHVSWISIRLGSNSLCAENAARERRSY
jgi:ABC-2 type transport system ATP-binding protein